MAESPPRIILVGHCGPDSYVLRSAISSAVRGAVVDFAPDDSSLEQELDKASLLLVNRNLDGDYSLGLGVELIAAIRDRLGNAAPKMMLVSNYPEAQAEAIAAGALPGFGKRDVYADETKARIRAALGWSD
jgi:two-component system, chemotaxis family, chemotaxis protein CheY